MDDPNASDCYREKTVSIIPPDLDEGGDSGQVDVKIASIETFDGSKISPPIAGVTAIVGANNSGKSTFLREINQLLTVNQRSQLPTMRLIKEMAIDKHGSYEDLVAWLLEHSTYTQRGNQKGFASPAGGTVVPTDHVRVGWLRSNQVDVTPSLSMVAPFFLHYVTATNRASGIAPYQRRGDIAQHAENPMHILEDDPDMMARVRGLSERIFRQTLTLDPLSGNVQLRVGNPSVTAPRVDAITPEYRAAMVDLAPLQEQGDGMTGVLGLLVPIVCGAFRVVLIDEPEAFLHPPQARIVGQVLGELSREHGLQIIIATHDRNILVGLLQSAAPVTVIRLDRNTSITRVHELDHERVRELWNNPVLRYSNVLDGIFHRAVVLCEAEQDCTFYSASLEGAGEMGRLSFPPGDVLFVPTGGKDGIPGMVRSLGAVSVPTVAVPDLDVLNDEGKVSTLVKSFNGDWPSCADDYRIATAAFRQPRAVITNGQILHQVRAILEADPTALYDRQTNALLKAAIRSEPSPWELLKKYGDRAFKGQALQAANRLFGKFDKLGIAIVRAGVLENLAPDVQSSKGPSWLTEALAKKSYLESSAQDHIEHVIRIVEHRLNSNLASH
jgi:ABC-type transporter Mla maintaining outer membrane lipid asymmetry ATPase subunit MlaF